MGKKKSLGIADLSNVSASSITINGDLSIKEEKVDSKEEYEALCQSVNNIAQPLANRKLARKIYKLIRKASKQKHYLRQGITEVQRAIRKGETGMLVLAGDVSPVEVYCHMPALCEEKEIPYVFTPSREHLGLAAGHKRPSIMILIKLHSDYAELYKECEQLIKVLPLPI